MAIGWAHFAPDRAVTELRSLFRGQWSNGMVPQIVFDSSVALDAYEPRHRTWGTAGLCPPHVATSGICQPPVHNVALARVRAIAERRDDKALSRVDRAIVELYPRLAAWHRWLHNARDPDGTVPPTTAVDDPAFDPRSYWRGPTWPVITWLLWWALDRDGHHDRAEALRTAAIAQLGTTGCSEYADPVSGLPLGSPAPSWTAAVALDWLAHDSSGTADGAPPTDEGPPC